MTTVLIIVGGIYLTIGLIAVGVILAQCSVERRWHWAILIPVVLLVAPTLFVLFLFGDLVPSWLVMWLQSRRLRRRDGIREDLYNSEA